MDKIHDDLFKMLLMFDSICRKHNITYWLDSGTAIGAVREHDFIPWDDDIDVAILRPQYNKLRRILKRELPKGFRLIEPKDYDPYFFDFVPKLINLEVPLRRETEEDRVLHNYQNRLSIDFVILDEVPDNKLLQKIIKFRCKMIYGMCSSKRWKIHDEKYTVPQKIAAGVCRTIGRFFSFRHLIYMYQHNTRKYAGIRSNTLIRSNSLLYYIDFFSKECYRDTVMMDFHGSRFPVPIGYDKILTQMYGNYMIPSKDYVGYVSHTDGCEEE